MERHATMTDGRDGEGNFVPGNGAPVRSPQLLRDLKPARPGVPETVERVPLRIAVPLLVGKAHAELHEAFSDRKNPEEYADVEEALEALAEACGHSPEAVAAAVEARRGIVSPSAYAGHRNSTTFRLLAGDLHERIEEVALDVSDPGRHAAALTALRMLAACADVPPGEIDRARAAKKASKGGFSGHLLWSSSEFHGDGVSPWRPISEAKKDGTLIWAALRDDVYPVLCPKREELERWNGAQFPMRHPGLADDGFDMGWNIPLVGQGGFPDSWIAGWRDMPDHPGGARDGAGE